MQSMSAKFALREIGPGCLLLTCQGGLSWEDREVLAAGIERFLHGGNPIRGLIADMAGVNFVNSAGLGALFQLVQRMRSRSARLVFVNVPPQIERLFATVGLTRLADIAPDVDTAWQTLPATGSAAIDVEPVRQPNPVSGNGTGHGAGDGPTSPDSFAKPTHGNGSDPGRRARMSGPGHAYGNFTFGAPEDGRGLGADGLTR